MYRKRHHTKANEIKVRLDDETYDQLLERASRNRMQRAPYARELIEQGLDEMLKSEDSHNEVSYSLSGVACRH
mgnify:CR=1 FL=1